MEFIVISNDKNILTQPQFTQRAIKFNLFDVWHLYDTVVCETSLKLEGCDNAAPSFLSAANMPTTYNAAFNVGYDLNYLADQDGTVDVNCTRAFINKITMKEQFNYIKCMEDMIPFDNVLNYLMADIGVLDVGSTLLSTIQTAVSGVYDNTATTRNDTNYTTLDINSGAYNRQKIIKTDLFQFQSLPLYDGQQFLESFELECNKESGNLSISLKIKTMTLDIILTKLRGNAVAVPLAAEC